MTATSPAVDRVVEILQVEGYEVRPAPIRIGSLNFDFSAVLTARSGLDLVIIVDTVQQRPERIHDALESLGRALDRLASRRPITVVLVGPPPRQALVEALARTGRVLIVGTPVGQHANQSLRDTLSVLLPLKLPEVSLPSLQSWEELSRRLLDQDEPAVVTPLLEAAADGPNDVRDAMRKVLAAPFEDDDV